MFSFGLVEDQPMVRFQIPRPEACQTTDSWTSFQPSRGIGSMVRMPMNHWSPDDRWLSSVAEVASEELSRTKKSQFQSSHRPFLHQVFCDEDARESFVSFVTAPLQTRMIETYKRLVVARGIQDELYKWELFTSSKSAGTSKLRTLRRCAGDEFQELDSPLATSFWNVLWKDPSRQGVLRKALQ